MSQRTQEQGVREIVQALGQQPDEQVVRAVRDGMTYDYLDSLCDHRQETNDERKKE